MLVVADAGPLIAAAYTSDDAHELAASLVSALGRDLLIPDPVIPEVDSLLHARRQGRAARAFLEEVAKGTHVRVTLSPAQFARATEIDRRYADLDLGYVDAAVMAVAESEDLPILTFDFADFRAVVAASGRPWRLVVDERAYADARRRR